MTLLHYEDFLTEDESLFLFKLGCKQAAGEKLELEAKYFDLLMKIAEKAYEKGLTDGKAPPSSQPIL